MEQRNIEKARRLFKERGAIRREYIRDEIAYSWVRSRLHTKKDIKIKDEKYEINYKDKAFSADELVSFIYNNLPESYENYTILLCGYDGKVKNKMNENTIKGINIPTSFREEFIGTNGIGTGIGLKRNFIVVDKEHYNEDFDGFVTGSIFDMKISMVNCFVGFIVSHEEFIPDFFDYISNLDFSSLCEFKEKVLNDTTPILLEGSIDSGLLPYCLIGSSATKNSLRNLVMSKSFSSSLINIYSKNGAGKEYLARFIHSKSARSDYKFYKIDGKNDVDFSIDALIDEFENGTLYIENYSSLSIKSKSKIKKKINCKLVNSIGENDCNERNVAFIVSENIDGVSRFEEMDKLTDLKLFSSGLNIFLDGVNEVKSDLIELIRLELIKRINSLKDSHEMKLMSPKALDDICKELYNELANIDKLSYRYIDRNFDKFIDFGSGNIIVNQLKEEKCQSNSTAKYMSLKEVERDYIEKIMKITDNNVQKSAEILGVGRTTIYRKLKE